MSALMYQLVRDDGSDHWMNELFTAEEFLTAFESRGFKPTGTVGGDDLRPELRGQPRFTDLHGPMWGGEHGSSPVVRYEDAKVSEALSA